MKKLHLALDVLTVEEAENILEQTAECIDIIELGTPLMVSQGAKAVQQLKEKYPNKTVFADVKIMDGGAIMSDIVFNAGADMVSVLGAANDETIREVIDKAREKNKKVLVDLCAIKDLKERAQQIDSWNPEYICVHVGYDVQSTGVDPIEEIRKIEGVFSKKAAAGGIRLSNFETACKADIDDIIVGGGIYKAEDPSMTARQMFEIINNYR